MSKLIYAADDELNIRQLIQSFLEEEGYEVETFETGDALLEKFKQKPSDLVILDVMMPGTDGLSICNTIRKFSSVPILILTARDTTADYVTGITLGCDDYFTKPFSPVMLTMRVKAMFRRVELDKAIPYDEKLEYGDIEIMPKQKVAKCRGEDLRLTITELNVLQYLMEKNGIPFYIKEHRSPFFKSFIVRKIARQTNCLKKSGATPARLKPELQTTTSNEYAKK